MLQPDANLTLRVSKMIDLQFVESTFMTVMMYQDHDFDAS